METQLMQGDCLEVMKDFESNSIDAIITDPPYGLSAARNSGKKSKGGFMGKKWDYDVPKVEVWAECLRVLKPGGHILCACGTRTQHRMAVNIEDAGFEIRDMIAWVYSTGFPKSLNISKKIDQMAFHEWLTAHPVEHAKYKEQIKQAKGNHELTERVGRKFRKMAGVEREVVGVDPEAKRRNKGPMLPADKGWNANSMGNGKLCPITSPATPAAKQWDGWGTSLKPSVEIWTLAQKSLTSGSECGIILENIIANFKEILCQYQLFVEIAEKHFKSSPSEFSGVVSIAQWIAGENTSTRGDLFALMVTLQSGSETNSSWNTVLSWLNTLAALCETMNTHTTSMVSSLTIDLKILESLEWENIFQSIIPANDNQTNGWNAPVLNAVSIFNVLELKLKNILKHFVPENAFHHQNGTSAKNVGQDLPQTTQKENTALLNVTTQPTEGTNEKELKKSASSAEKSLKQSHVEPKILRSRMYVKSI